MTLLSGLALSSTVSTAGYARDAGSFDDPKLEREWSDLRARLRDPPAPGASAAETTNNPLPRVPRGSGLGPAPGAGGALADNLPAPRPSTSPPTLAGETSRRAGPPAPRREEAEDGGPGAGDGWPYRPRLKLTYRRFSLASLAATGDAATTADPATDGPSATEAFEGLSIETYPMSGYLRVGTSTQLGWQSGRLDGHGDYLLAQSFSSGFQIPGRVTPFSELSAGAGYMRRVPANGSSLHTAYWQAGIEAGVEIYVAGRAYTSLAIGYFRTDNLLLMNDSPMSLKQDTWELKLGLGI